MLGTIFDVWAVIERPDTTATDFDESLREPKRRTLNSFGDSHSPIGARGDVYQAPIAIPVQVLDDDFERLEQLSSGDNSVGFFDLTLSRRSARRLGLLKADGLPDIPKETRLTEIRRGSATGQIIVTIDYPPGLYVHEVMPRSLGLNPFGNSTNNIWFLRFRSRDISKR
jgi:hypothetical protein